MALDDLLAAIQAEAAARIAAELDAVRAEADAILRTARTDSERRRSEVLSAREAELRAVAGAKLAAASREARSAVLGARQRLLDDVLGAARARLADASRSEAYRSALPGRVDAAMAYLGDVPCVIRCAPDLLQPLEAAVAGHAASMLEVEADEAILGGFRLSSRDGLFEVDETLEGRLEQVRAAVAVELIRRVEPGTSP